MELKNDMLILHYKLETGTLDDNYSFNINDTRTFDVIYNFNNNKWTTKDSSKFEGLDLNL